MALVALAAVLAEAAGYLAGGSSGLVIVTLSAGVVTLLAVRLRIAGAPAKRPKSGQVGRVNSAFSSYRRIESALATGQLSRRYFDLVTRPVLARLLAALLADRHRVEDTDAARKAVGDELWPLLAPEAPEADPAVPGISLAALTAITGRLEEL